MDKMKRIGKRKRRMIALILVAVIALYYCGYFGKVKCGVCGRETRYYVCGCLALKDASIVVGKESIAWDTPFLKNKCVYPFTRVCPDCLRQLADRLEGGD